MNKYIYAYTDESGNTGNNLFDVSQPYFWTGTLLSKIDLDKIVDYTIFECINTLGVTELHANKLGLDRIERIAYKLSRFIDLYVYKFIFTRVEKTHVAGTKFVDTLLDSGINKAVSNLHYGVKYLRLLLAQIIIYNLSPKNRKEFWDIYKTGNVINFRNLLNRLKWNIINKVNDNRAKQLICDAIDWAQENPEVILESARNDLDAPNMIAFSLLVSNIHKILEKDSLKVTRFIHDEQNQFAKTIKELYKMHSRLTFSGSPFAFITDLKDMDTFQCPIELLESKSSNGLQLIDIALWLIKRYYEKGFDNYENCSQLVETIISKNIFLDFSHEQLFSDVFESTQLINSIPLSQKEEANAIQIVRQIEEKRINRMKGLS